MYAAISHPFVDEAFTRSLLALVMIAVLAGLMGMLLLLLVRQRIRSKVDDAGHAGRHADPSSAGS